jgi:diguanylate cyclase (GGDEF)-like protein
MELDMAEITQNSLPKSLLKKEISQKISPSLIDYVYMQIHTGLFASQFCATLVFLDLYSSDKNNFALTSWFIFFLTITIIRATLALLYKKNRGQVSLPLWGNLYVFGSFLGGVSWGLLAVSIFYYATPIQQILIMLMLAGVTAGVVPLSAAMPKATITFLIFSLFPYIISIMFLKNSTYLLFDVALSIYLMYSIFLSLKVYQVIEKLFLLQFDNDALLKNLTDAKKQLEIINKNLEKIATHDPLTQVANRALFTINLDEAIRRACRNNKIIGLFYLDLDKFKSINDRYGHHIGDYVLLVIAKRLKNFLGSNEIIARLGGDEFTIIVENANNVDEIMNTAKMICESLSNTVRVNNINLNISASIGISIYPDDGTDSETLMRCADKTMYYVKTHGGNNFHLSRV